MTKIYVNVVNAMLSVSQIKSTKIKVKIKALIEI